MQQHDRCAGDACMISESASKCCLDATAWPPISRVRLPWKSVHAGVVVKNRVIGPVSISVFIWCRTRNTTAHLIVIHMFAKLFGCLCWRVWPRMCCQRLGGLVGPLEENLKCSPDLCNYALISIKFHSISVYLISLHCAHWHTVCCKWHNTHFGMPTSIDDCTINHEHQMHS